MAACNYFNNSNTSFLSCSFSILDSIKLKNRQNISFTYLHSKIIFLEVDNIFLKAQIRVRVIKIIVTKTEKIVASFPSYPVERVVSIEGRSWISMLLKYNILEKYCINELFWLLKLMKLHVHIWTWKFMKCHR